MSRTTRRSDGQRVLETTTVDQVTGEVLKGNMVFVPEKKKSAFGDRWFAMAQNAMDFLATNRKLIGEEGFAVFFKIASRLDFENYIQVNQAELARELGMKPSSFSRAVKKLLELQVIMKGPKVGVSQTYRLNPSAGWKGSAKNHFTAMQEAKKKGWRVIDNDQPELPL